MFSKFSRRRFLAAAGGGAALAAVGSLRLSSAADPKIGPKIGAKVDPKLDPRAEYGGFLMGIQSYTLRDFPTDAMLDLVRRFGLHSVEMFLKHFNYKSSPEQIDAMKRNVADHGIRMMGFGVIGFGRDQAANRRVFEFAKRAGIRNLSADPEPESFGNLEKLVAEFDVRIAIHNHGPGSRYDKIQSVWKAIKDRHPNIGACADLGHYIRSAEDPVAAIRQFRGRLFGIHLKDFAEQKKITHGVILGKGHLDVPAVFRALREVKFPADGCLALEYEEKPENPLEDVKQCLAVAAAAARQSHG